MTNCSPNTIYAVEIQDEDNDWLVFEIAESPHVRRLKELAEKLSRKQPSRVVRFSPTEIVWIS